MKLDETTERSLDAWLGEGWVAEPLVGDASVRAYYRVSARGETYILAFYPPQLHDQLERFLAAWSALAGRVPVPAVHHHSDQVILQEDAGDQSLFQLLHQDRSRGLDVYRRAVDILVQLQGAPDPGLLPPFTSGYFLNELEMAREYFVEKLLQREPGVLATLAPEICSRVAAHPYRVCHRDYHGHNLYIKNDSLYVIDFQDVRMGPDTYDLASLLRDRGVARLVGPEAEIEMLDRWATASGAEGDHRRRYFEALLQRSIKILGTFAKQPIVRGMLGYLRYIPPTLESVHRCLDELPEFEPLRDIFPLSFDLEAAEARARELSRGGRQGSPS